MCIVCYPMVPLSENSVDIPNLSGDCYHEATNSQFQFETQASLEEALLREYGNVRISIVYFYGPVNNNNN